MPQTTVRIREATRETLRAIAEQEGRSMQSILERAIELYRRRKFLEGVNEGYAALKADPVAWARVAEERAWWDTTLADGLEANEHWDEFGKPTPRRPKTRRK